MRTLARPRRPSSPALTRTPPVAYLALPCRGEPCDQRWTVAGGRLYGKPAAWLDVANPGRGGARSQLATVLTYVGAHVAEDACRHVPVDRTGGEIQLGPGADGQLSTAVSALLAAVGSVRRA